jgi:hypothetical protein
MCFPQSVPKLLNYNSWSKIWVQGWITFDGFAGMQQIPIAGPYTKFSTDVEGG